jgi:glycogen debranching enzyme
VRLEEVLSAEGWPYASSGAGRFHCLFGRASLITSLPLLPTRPDVARATVAALAARQGVRADPLTLEEPGKIGHEFRASPPSSFVEAGWPVAGPFAYYGTADATSWFLLLCGALGEWSDATRAAAAWVVDALDAGAGLVRHIPGAFGLAQQGWRDTIDAAGDADGGGFLRADGTNPAPPLADVDTQAVTLAALRSLSRHDPAFARRADDLHARLSALPVDTMAVEAGEVLVPGAGSQLGWLLWAGVEGPFADRLCEPDVLTDFGLRTLSSRDRNFRPDAYHRGSVWPFDCWLGWGGLRAAGRLEQAERVRTGVLAALDRLGSPHELYAVRDGRVEPIKTSNAVQAWTIGARWALENEWDGRT